MRAHPGLSRCDPSLKQLQLPAAQAAINSSLDSTGDCRDPKPPLQGHETFRDISHQNCSTVLATHGHFSQAAGHGDHLQGTVIQCHGSVPQLLFLGEEATSTLQCRKLAPDLGHQALQGPQHRVTWPVSGPCPCSSTL